MVSDWREWLVGHVQAPTDIHEHLLYIFDTLVAMRAKSVMEIGVRGAQSTRAILAALEVTDGRLLSLDIGEPDGFPDETFAAVAERRWKFAKADSRSTILMGTLDALMIDSEHTLPTTLIELLLHARRLRPGGLVLMHDTVSMPAVSSAISIFMLAEPETWSYQEFKHCNGLGVLTRGGSVPAPEQSEGQSPPPDPNP